MGCSAGGLCPQYVKLEDRIKIQRVRRKTKENASKNHKILQERHIPLCLAVLRFIRNGWQGSHNFPSGLPIKPKYMRKCVYFVDLAVFAPFGLFINVYLSFSVFFGGVFFKGICVFHSLLPIFALFSPPKMYVLPYTTMSLVGFMPKGLHELHTSSTIAQQYCTVTCRQEK